MASEEEEEAEPRLTQTDEHNGQSTNQKEGRDGHLTRNSGDVKIPLLRHQVGANAGLLGGRRQDGAFANPNAGNASLKVQNSMSFPRGLQLKPPISKGRS